VTETEEEMNEKWEQYNQQLKEAVKQLRDLESREKAISKESAEISSHLSKDQQQKGQLQQKLEQQVG